MTLKITFCHKNHLPYQENDNSFAFRPLIDFNYSILLYFCSVIKSIIMAIKKQYLKSKPVCKVTFSVPAEEAKSVVVVGNFNDWNAKKATKLKKLKNGTFKATVDLEKDNSYEFRYLVDGKSYLNDDQADSYAWNDYAGAENSVINL